MTLDYIMKISILIILPVVFIFINGRSIENSHIIMNLSSVFI